LTKVEFTFVSEQNENSSITRTIPLDVIVRGRDTITLEYIIDVVLKPELTAIVESNPKSSSGNTKITIQ